MSKPIEDMLVERRSTHGHFTDHAACAQDLKATLRLHAARRSVPLSATQTEALEMILHKVGRIVAGDAGFADHWDDIAGYAKIANYKVPS